MRPLMLSAGGLAITIAKIVFGATADALGARKTNVIFFLIQCCGWMILCMAGLHSTALMLAGVCIAEIGMTTTSVGTAAYTKDMSSEKTYAANAKRFQIATMAGAVVITSVPGIIADWTGSYVGAYVLIIVCLLGSLLLIRHAYQGKRTERNADRS